MKGVLLSLVLFFFISCDSKIKKTQIINNDNPKYEIDLREVEEISLTSLLKIEDIITLQSLPKPGYFKSIDRFIATNDGFILFDKSLSKIYFFQKNGDFIRQIGKRGGGPSEYKSIYDVAFDYENSEIHILSNDDRKIFIYSISDGFTKSLKLDYFTNTFYYKNGYYYIDKGYDSEDNFNLIKADKNATPLSSFFSYPLETPVMSFAFTGGINAKGNFLTYTEATSSVIFEINESEITPLYSIYIDENTWDYAKRHKFDEFYRELPNFQTSYLINSYLCTSDNIIFEYQHNKFYKRVYYKNTGNLYKINGKLDRIFSMPIGLIDNKIFVAAVYPEVYKSLKDLYSNIPIELKAFSPPLFERLEAMDAKGDDSSFLVTYSLL